MFGTTSLSIILDQLITYYLKILCATQRSDRAKTILEVARV